MPGTHNENIDMQGKAITLRSTNPEDPTVVAATIIKTITLDLTIKSISLLALMVGIRTILGWTTVLEMDGKWPWHNEGKDTPVQIPPL